MEHTYEPLPGGGWAIRDEVDGGVIQVLERLPEAEPLPLPRVHIGQLDRAYPGL